MEFREYDRDGKSYGDTYEQYTKRCQAAGLEPQSFNTWLLFELNVVLPRQKPGPAPHLDGYQRLQVQL
jgi:hypothetical protein